MRIIKYEKDKDKYHFCRACCILRAKSFPCMSINFSIFARSAPVIPTILRLDWVSRSTTWCVNYRAKKIPSATHPLEYIFVTFTFLASSLNKCLSPFQSACCLTVRYLVTTLPTSRLRSTSSMPWPPPSTSLDPLVDAAGVTTRGVWPVTELAGLMLLVCCRLRSTACFTRSSSWFLSTPSMELTFSSGNSHCDTLVIVL